MKQSEVKMILVLILVGVVIVGGLVLWRNGNNEETPIVEGETATDQNTEEYVQVLGDGSKLNVSEELAKTKTLDGFEFTNIQLKETEGITTLLADVENKTGAATTQIKAVKIEVLDKQGNVITSPIGFIDPMGVGEKVQLNTAVSADVANAYDFRVTNP